MRLYQGSNMYGGYVYDSDSGLLVSLKRGKPRVMAISTDRSGKKYIAITASFGKTTIKVHMLRSYFNRVATGLNKKTRSEIEAAIDAKLNRNKNKFVAAIESSDDEWVDEPTTPKASVNTGKFIVSSVIDGVHSISTKPVYHDTEAAAKREAERLAKLSPNKEFVVFKRIASVKATGVTWS